MNPQTIFWLTAAIVLFLLEASTVNLVSMWFGIGALFAIVPASLNMGFGVQIAVFIVISALSLAILYPKIKKRSAKDKQPTNADRIIGQRAIVTEAIDVNEGTGQVKVMGSIWSAISEDKTDIEKGMYVKVIGIEGVRAIVVKEEEK